MGRPSKFCQVCSNENTQVVHISKIVFSFYNLKGGGASFKMRVVGSEKTIDGVTRTVVRIDRYPSRWEGEKEYYDIVYNDKFIERIYTAAEVYVHGPKTEL